MARALKIDGLNYDNNLIDCLKLLFQQRTNELYLHYAKIFSERNIEVLHNTRVAARRLQALFKVFRPLFPYKKYSEVYIGLRQFVRLLGPVRELDVLTAMLGDYISKFSIADVKALMLLFANLNYETLERRANLFKHPEIIDFADKQNKFMQFYEKHFNNMPVSRVTELFPFNSFRENAGKIISALFDKVLSYRIFVVGHPRNKFKLHRMRIKAKPLRYMMEIYQNAFDKNFTSGYENIKNFVEKTGNIHDIDILILKLRKFLNEIRFFNKNQKSMKDYISTRPIRGFLTELTKKRHEEYMKVTEQIKKWEEEKFRDKILLATSD